MATESRQGMAEAGAQERGMDTRCARERLTGAVHMRDDDAIVNGAGWTVEARALIDRAIAAHGGVARWRAVRRIELPWQRGAGALLRLKGYGRSFPAPSMCEVRPHERVAIFHGYPDQHRCGWFIDGRVAIEDVAAGTAPASLADHRATFAGLAKHRRWAPLDALYFFGYALTHYHGLPFSLLEADLIRVLRAGGRAVGVDVRFPPGVHTHCDRQQIYFEQDGRIVRHDYVAEVIGPWARGAHYWEEYVTHQGLLIACRRRVVARVGSVPLPMTVLDVRLGRPTVHS